MGRTRILIAAKRILRCVAALFFCWREWLCGCGGSDGGQVFDGVDGDFDGSDVVSGEVVKTYAKGVGAFEGDADLFVVGDACVEDLTIDGG